MSTVKNNTNESADTDDPTGVNTMTDEAETRLHERIDKLNGKFDSFDDAVTEKLNLLLAEVKIIKVTCATRGTTCAAHVEQLDLTIRGNGKEGLLTRVRSLEQQEGNKEKFAYLVIGALVSGVVALALAMLTNLMGG